MKRVTRRVTVGALSAAVVATMAGVSTWALAGENTAPAGPVRLIVVTKKGADTAAPLRTVSSLGVRSMDAAGPAQQALSMLNAQTLEVSAARKDRVITALRADPNVSYVEIDHVRKAYDLKPDDPMYTDNHQPEVDQVKLPAAWATETGKTVKIAVLDTGVTAAGDLTGAVLSGYNYVSNNANTTDDYGHGTTVSSLIAARGDNGAGMAGACWECVILPVKVLDANGSGYDSNVAKGVIFATDKGASVINMSLGGTEYSKVLSDAVAYANARGVLVVAAAGNEGRGTLKNTKQYPAALTDVVAVGATARESDDRADFSSYNKSGDSWVDMAAPGIVTGMDRAGNYHTGEPGTSFAAPMVSGAAGLIKSVHPTYSGWSLKRALLLGARPISPAGWSNYGMLDVPGAFDITTDEVAPKITGTTPAEDAFVHGTITVTPSGVSDADSGVRNVTLYADGVYKSRDDVAPFALSYNSAGRNGPVKLQVRVYDKAGNMTAYDRSVKADNVLPKAKITSGPANKAKVKGVVTIKATATDSNGIGRVDLLINGKVVVKDATAPYSLAFKVTNFSSPMKVQVRALDKAGNSGYDTARTYTR